jgi:plasmid stability protein
MGQILVRKLPDAVIDLLKGRAAAAGRSLEQELRLILIEAALPARTRLKQTAAGLRDQLAGERVVDTLALLREVREP